MWLLSIAQMLTVVAAGTQPGFTAGHESVSPPEPISTRQTYFAIPFEIEQVDHPSLGAAEIQLWVSRDRGATWQHETSVAPTTKQFLFRAPSDGEYWFAVRTRDHAGNFRPQVINNSGLRVIVDTQAPSLTIDAQRGSAGQIVAKWKIDEARIKPDTFKLLYRTGGSQQWETVAVDPANFKTDGTTSSGEAIWWAPAGQGRVEIRVEVADAAGNPNVSHAQVTTVASPVPPSDMTAQVRPNNPPLQTSQQDWQASPAQNPWGKQNQNGYSPGQPSPSGPSSHDTQNQGYGGGPMSMAGDSVANRNDSSGTSSDYSGGSQSYGNQSPSNHSSWGGDHSTYGGDNRPSIASVAAQPSPPYQSQYKPDTETSQLNDSHSSGYYGQSTTSGSMSYNSAEHPTTNPTVSRTVNSNLFEIEYSNPTQYMAVGRVELWGTRDGGLSWKSFGYDSDSRSPMLARVPEEGTYGFKVVFHPSHGAPAQPPRRGQSPDIVICVDLTRPEARLLGVSPSPNGSNEFVIRWQAADTQLADAPISLYFSDVSTNQWRVIATGLPNSGEYRWNPPAGLPPQVQIRIEAEDRAGNIASVETRNPIQLVRNPQPQSQQPSYNVEIQNVRPVGQSRQTPPRRYYIR